MSAIAANPRIVSGADRRPVGVRPRAGVVPAPGPRPGTDSVARGGVLRLDAVRQGVGDDAPLRLTRRGRVVLVVIALLIVVGGVMGGRAFADAPAGATPVQTYSVQSGDTLWSIASGVAEPGEDVRDVVIRLQRLNSLADGSITAGQVLMLPAGS